MSAVMEISRSKSDFWFFRGDIPVIKDSKLSPCDKAVYMIFCYHADIKTRETLISVKTLAEEARCGIRTAQKSIKVLIERGVLKRKEQYKNGRQTVSSYRLIGHNAECYQNAGLAVPEENGGSRGAILAETAENNVIAGAESAGYSENCTPGGAGFAHRYLEPIFNENQNISPLTPQGESGEGADFEPEDKKPCGTYDTGETSKARRQEFYGAILDAYHAILPELPRIGTLTASSVDLIEARIREDPERGNPGWWRLYFNRVREFPWPMGENGKGWRADFHWLISEKGMEKITSEHFSRYPAAGKTTAACLEHQRKYADERGVVDGAAILRDS